MTEHEVLHSPEFIEGTRRGIEDWRAGQVKPLSEALTELFGEPWIFHHVWHVWRPWIKGWQRCDIAGEVKQVTLTTEVPDG